MEGALREGEVSEEEKEKYMYQCKNNRVMHLHFSIIATHMDIQIYTLKKTSICVLNSAEDTHTVDMAASALAGGQVHQYLTVCT